MAKRVILITGTPCVGKTSVAHMLCSKLNAVYMNLTELAMKENLTVGKDKDRDTVIVDETKMKQKIQGIIEKCAEEDMIIDGHYAALVVPKRLATYVFVLRRDPIELRKLMETSGFSGRKLWENMASEILDVCLADALGVHSKAKVCELDITSKTVEETVSDIQDVMNGCKECRIGVVDWLGKLESEGLLDECLKI